jgi:predicted nuclease of predicted toxin-antitoxin system
MNLKPVNHYKFLVDVNLPKKFYYFKTADFIHVADINPRMTDREIWDYALKNNLILLSKDADFYDLFLIKEKHPKVVNFRFGNLTLNDLHHYFLKFWPTIIDHLDTASFIIAQEDKLFIFP